MSSKLGACHLLLLLHLVAQLENRKVQVVFLNYNIVRYSFP